MLRGLGFTDAAAKEAAAQPILVITTCALETRP